MVGCGFVSGAETGLRPATAGGKGDTIPPCTGGSANFAKRLSTCMQSIWVDASAVVQNGENHFKRYKSKFVCIYRYNFTLCFFFN